MPFTRQGALCAGDVAIDDRTAMIFPTEAPLSPGPGLRDARAVWTYAPARPDGTVLVYLHGHNNYVTVDEKGKSRVPDWATDDAARAGAAGKLAAPLNYQFDRIESAARGRRPIVLVPEDAIHGTGSFWAREPAGQYADPSSLGKMIDGSLAHLSCLSRPGGGGYLRESVSSARLRRVFLSGHSGAGLPFEEAARSSLILPGAGGVPAELWLFDCTYWSKVAGFADFCARWSAAGRLKAGDSSSARFICIYRPKTDTEGVADGLRQQIAKTLGTAPESLVADHLPSADDAAVRRQLSSAPVLFLRTNLPHDSIPTYFVPQLLASASL